MGVGRGPDSSSSTNAIVTGEAMTIAKTSDVHDARVALVTGGSRGIGLAIVERLVADGMQVVTCGRSARPDGLPSEVLWYQANVASSADCTQLVSDVLQTHGSIDVVVNNAGIQIEKTLVDTTDDDWDNLVSINCRGVFNMSRAVLPHMQSSGGCIVNMGSISGHTVDATMAIYNASKAFVHGLTRSIAVDHGPMVRCNAVLPGWVMTDMAKDGFARSPDPQQAEHEAISKHPARRLGVPQDIANAVSWLASDEARFVTGQFLTVDGGLTASSPLNVLPQE